MEIDWIHIGLFIIIVFLIFIFGKHKWGEFKIKYKDFSFLLKESKNQNESLSKDNLTTLSKQVQKLSKQVQKSIKNNNMQKLMDAVNNSTKNNSNTELNGPNTPTKKYIIDTIINSNPKKDWDKVLDCNRGDEIEIRTFSHNIKIKLEINHSEIGIHNDDFREEWANCFPDRRARSNYCQLYYDNQPIEQFILVSVDGARATLPLPDIQTKKISKLYYQVAKIFDTLNTLDDYMRMAGLSVEK